VRVDIEISGGTIVIPGNNDAVGAIAADVRLELIRAHGAGRHAVGRPHHGAGRSYSLRVDVVIAGAMSYHVIKAPPAVAG